MGVKIKTIAAKAVNIKEGQGWRNRNFFFAATAFFVAVNIILYAALGSLWGGELGGEVSWTATINFRNIWRVVFINGFSHLNIQHTLLNMLCFFVVGVYLERKMGSVKFFALTFILGFFANIFIAANAQIVFFSGFSGTNFALYFYVIVDYIFYHISKKRNKLDTWLGAIVLGLIYFAMCFSGGVVGVSFAWYPYDLFNNIAHYSGALAGLVIAILIKLVRLDVIMQKNTTNTTHTQ